MVEHSPQILASEEKATTTTTSTQICSRVSFEELPGDGLVSEARGPIVGGNTHVEVFGMEPKEIRLSWY